MRFSTIFTVGIAVMTSMGWVVDRLAGRPYHQNDIDDEIAGHRSPIPPRVHNEIAVAYPLNTTFKVVYPNGTTFDAVLLLPGLKDIPSPVVNTTKRHYRDVTHLTLQSVESGFEFMRNESAVGRPIVMKPTSGATVFWHIPQEHMETILRKNISFTVDAHCDVSLTTPNCMLEPLGTAFGLMMTDLVANAIKPTISRSTLSVTRRADTRPWDLTWWFSPTATCPGTTAMLGTIAKRLDITPWFKYLPKCTTVEELYNEQHDQS